MTDEASREAPERLWAEFYRSDGPGGWAGWRVSRSSTSGRANPNEIEYVRADALLIAAAPELYESLKATLALIRRAQERLCSYLEPAGSDDLFELTNDLLIADRLPDTPTEQAIGMFAMHEMEMAATAIRRAISKHVEKVSTNGN